MEAKKSKLDSHENQMGLAGPSNLTSNEETPSAIQKLDIDCLEELFEWMSIKDLFALRQTCKRLKRAADYYIKTNYPAIGSFQLEAGNIDMFRQMDEGSIGLVQKLEILIGIKYDDAMNGAQLEAIKNVFNRVEIITIEPRAIDDDIYEALLKHCHNLKELFILYEDTWSGIVGTNNNWLLHQYPTLECISFQEMYPRIFVERIDELVQFFIQNRNIRIFSVNLEFLREYGLLLSDSGTKFEQLHLVEHTSPDFLDYDCLELLVELHEKGFYKTLHLSGEMFDIHMDENDLEMITPLGVERLSLTYSTFIIPSISDVKEIYFDGFDKPEQFENVKHVVERLHFRKLNSDEVILVIREFPKLNLFKFDKLTGAETVDLSTLNKEREKLTRPSKVTIYVDEKIFLATKWTLPTINYRYIELKRSQTYYWEDLFRTT